MVNKTLAASHDDVEGVWDESPSAAFLRITWKETLAKGQSVGWALLHLPMQNGEVLGKIRKQNVTLGRRCLFCPCSGQGLSCFPAAPTAAGLDSGSSLCHSECDNLGGSAHQNRGVWRERWRCDSRVTASVQSLGESQMSPPRLHGTPCGQGMEVWCTLLGYTIHLPQKAVASTVLEIPST